MARRKFSKLKALMFEKEIRQIDLEPIVGHGINYISRRFNGKEAFNTKEMQSIGTMLEIPKEQWLDYFIE